MSRIFVSLIFVRVSRVGVLVPAFQVAPANTTPSLDAASLIFASTPDMRGTQAAGVLIGSGSDLLGPGQNRRGLEVVLKAKILGPMEAIVCATRNNAKIMRQDQALGTLEAGKLADVIAVRGDPLAQPEILDDPSRVALVVKDGRILKNLTG